MPGEEKEVIELGRKEIDPEQEAAYRNRVRSAKGVGRTDSLKGSEPVGSVPRPTGLPIFQETRKAGYADPLDEMGQRAGVQQGVQPRERGASVLRPETARQLEEATKAAQNAPPEEVKEETKKEEEEVEPFDSFDFNSRSEAEKVLDNKKRRKVIESRCKPMNFSDLLEKDEVRQVVPIIPGSFEPEFRSMTPGESLFVKQYMAKEENRTDLYLAEKYGLCQLACGLVGLNGHNYTTHLKSDGDVDKEVFEKKLRQLMKKSGYIVADLGLNYHWFDIRVRKLIVVDEVGNG